MTTVNAADPKALFGSDDDSSSGGEENTVAPVPQEEEHHYSAPAKPTQNNNLFGSDDEDDEAPMPTVVTHDDEIDDQPLDDRLNDDSSDDDNMDEDNRPVLETVIAVDNTAPILKHSDDVMYVSSIPKFLHVDPDEFNPETFEEEYLEGSVDAGTKNLISDSEKMKLRVENMIRWRVNAETGKRESNARFVKWSDGSMSLVVGGEMFQIESKDISHDNQVLFNLHPADGLMVAEQKIKETVTFQPFSTSSRTHKKLTATVLAKHQKVNRTKFIGAVVNPEAAKLEMEKIENEKLRNKKRMEAKQRIRTGGSRYGGELTAEDLEMDEDDEYWANRNRTRTSAEEKGQPVYDDDYEDDFVVSDDHVEFEEDEDDDMEEEGDNLDLRRGSLERGDGVVMHAAATNIGAEIDQDEDINSNDKGLSVDKRRRMVLSDEEE